MGATYLFVQHNVYNKVYKKMKINIPSFDFNQIENLINHFRQMDLT